MPAIDPDAVTAAELRRNSLLFEYTASGFTIVSQQSCGGQTTFYRRFLLAPVKRYILQLAGPFDLQRHLLSRLYTTNHFSHC